MTDAARTDPHAPLALVPSQIVRVGPTDVAVPPCPLCASPTARRTLRSGPRAGVEVWGCTAAGCRGRLDVGGTFGRSPSGHAMDAQHGSRPTALHAVLGRGRASSDPADAGATTADGLLRPSGSGQTVVRETARRAVRTGATPRGHAGRAPSGSVLHAVPTASVERPRDPVVPEAPATSAADVVVPAADAADADPPAPSVASPADEGAWWLTSHGPTPTRPVTVAPQAPVVAPVPGIQPDLEGLRRIGLWPQAEAPAPSDPSEAPIRSAAFAPPMLSGPAEDPDEAASGSPSVAEMSAMAAEITMPATPSTPIQAMGAATIGDAMSDRAPLAERTLPTATTSMPTSTATTVSRPAARIEDARRSASTATAAATAPIHGTRTVRHAVDAVARAAAAGGNRVRPVIQTVAARVVDLAIDIVRPEEPAAVAGGRDVAGASAQVEFERRRARHRRKMRAALPAVAATTIVGMAMAFAILLAFGVAIAGFGAVAVGALGIWGIAHLPAEAMAFGRTAAGERRTADYLEELRMGGYVVLHDRLAPGLRGNIDHIAVGPAGVFVIGTKALRGKLTIAA